MLWRCSGPARCGDVPIFRQLCGAAAGAASAGMRQLALGLALEHDLGLDASVPGRNEELFAVLRSLASGIASERVVYLWGAPGCGRSHLLRATARSAPGGVRWFGHDDSAAAVSPLLVADDVDVLEDDMQVQLFHAINRQRDGGGAVLAAGSRPPADLPLRPELRTRLAWGLVFQVQPLDDDAKVLALGRHARARGFELPADVGRYLLRHGERDLPSLVAALDGLDRSSLEQHRPLTVALLREVLETMPESGTGSRYAARQE